jgi:hypothetical protein
MQDERRGLSSGVLRSERASEPGAERSVSEATRARIIAHLERTISQTRAALSELRGVYPHSEDASRRRVALGAKLRRVERILRDLRQMRLL